MTASFRLIVIVAALAVGGRVEAAPAAKSPEELIQNIVSAAQKGAVEDFLLSLTDGARETVQRSYAKPSQQQPADEASALLTPPVNNTGRTNIWPTTEELKTSLSQLKAAEVLSKTEHADGLLELRIRSSIESANGETVSQEDTLLARQEDGAWKLTGWSPSVNVRVMSQPGAGQKQKISIHSQEGAGPH